MNSDSKAKKYHVFAPMLTTKGLQDRNMNILDGTTVENKGKLILTDSKAHIYYFTTYMEPFST